MSHIKSICTKKMKATQGDIYVACGSSPKEPQPQPAFQSPATSFILYRKLNFSSWVLFSFRMSIKSLAVIFMNTKTRPPGHISAKSKFQLQIYQAVSQTHNEKKQYCKNHDLKQTVGERFKLEKQIKKNKKFKIL